MHRRPVHRQGPCDPGHRATLTKAELEMATGLPVPGVGGRKQRPRGARASQVGEGVCGCASLCPRPHLQGAQRGPTRTGVLGARPSPQVGVAEGGPLAGGLLCCLLASVVGLEPLRRHFLEKRLSVFRWFGSVSVLGVCCAGC